MNRTNSFREFLSDNRRLLLFLALLLLGALGGSLAFTVSHTLFSADLTVMLQVSPIEGGIQGSVSELFSSCFSSFCLLALLFLTGLSACGAPVSVLVPVFFGLGLGMTEAYYYGFGAGGVAFVALLVLPHSLVTAAALLMGCAESLRMSLLIAGQLLPNAANCGGLWQDFRLYCMRFLLLVGVAFGAGVLDVGFRLAFLNLFINSTNPVVSVIAGDILAATFLPLVLLGLHRGLVPIYAIQIESLGGTTLFPAVAMAGAGQVGAAIALYIKAKRVGNHRLNRVIAGALPAGILGIGEPLIYGVTLPLMKPFITAGLGAGFGGAYVMLTHVMSTAYSPSGLLAVTHMLPECMLNYLIGMVIAYIAAAVITYIFIPVEDIENA